LHDPHVEADEMFQNAGEKGIRHDDPDDPPRRRANKAPGQGTFDNDRPPVAGAIGRATGAVVLEVVSNADRASLLSFVEEATQRDATVYTDEAGAYAATAQTGRTHKTVCHSAREWARDDDGDGIREVHTNTIEGFWTGLRNFLRPFRGVSKWFLNSYVVFYAAMHNAAGGIEHFAKAWLAPVRAALPGGFM
jgi:transposase